MAKKPKERWVEIDLDPPAPKEPKSRPFKKIKPFHREISLNGGHDWVEVEIVDTIPPEVKLTFGGSHFLTTQVFLHYGEDARNLASVLEEAAITISRANY